MSEFRLRIGNATLSLLFENDAESRAFGRYFDRASSAEEADIQLAINIRDDADRRTEVPSSLFLTKKSDGDGFSMAGGLVEGRFSPASGEGQLVVQRLLMKGGYARIYEQVFYQAYWSAVRRRGVNSFLLHSSGIVHEGRGYAFSGKSGAGKSTVTRLSSGSLILNDEITVIDFSGTTPMLRDTPFNGYFRQKKEGSAPLAAIMLLEQAGVHRLTPATGIRRVKQLSQELIPPIGLETPFLPTTYMSMLDIAMQISSRLPLYHMEFTPDPGFWSLIDQQEGA